MDDTPQVTLASAGGYGLKMWYSSEEASPVHGVVQGPLEPAEVQGRVNGKLGVGSCLPLQEM